MFSQEDARGVFGLILRRSRCHGLRGRRAGAWRSEDVRHPRDVSTDGSDVQPLRRPRFTLREAAERTGVSQSTVRRRLDAGDFPNAEQDAAGVWHVPVEDLLAAGLSLSRSPEERIDLRETRAVDQLRALLAEERAQREAAEQIAAERAEHLETVRTALRMLEAARVPCTCPCAF